MVCKASWTVVEAVTGSDRVRGRPSPAKVVRSTVMVGSRALGVTAKSGADVGEIRALAMPTVLPLLGTRAVKCLG